MRLIVMKIPWNLDLELLFDLALAGVDNNDAVLACAENVAILGMEKNAHTHTQY